MAVAGLAGMLLSIVGIVVTAGSPFIPAIPVALVLSAAAALGGTVVLDKGERAGGTERAAPYFLSAIATSAFIGGVSCLFLPEGTFGCNAPAAQPVSVAFNLSGNAKAVSCSPAENTYRLRVQAGKAPAL